MTSDRVIVLDLLGSVVAAAAWLGSGAAAATRRPRAALAMVALAVPASLGRAGSVAVLAGAGWWFVQEKVTVALPMLLVAGLAAVMLAVPALVASVRAGGPGGEVRRGAVLALFTAGYAAAADPLVTLLCVDTRRRGASR
jgi:hypothetical protein